MKTKIKQLDESKVDRLLFEQRVGNYDEQL